MMKFIHLLLLTGAVCLTTNCQTVNNPAKARDDFLAIKIALKSAKEQPHTFSATSSGKVKHLKSSAKNNDLPYSVEITFDEESGTIRYISSTRVNWIESNNPELPAIYNVAYAKVTDMQYEASSQSPERKIKAALVHIMSNPDGYKVSRGNGIVDYISKDNEIRYTDYWNSSEIEMISVKLRDKAITLKVPAGSISSTRIASTNEDLINQFYETCDAVNKRRVEINHEIAQKKEKEFQKARELEKHQVELAETTERKSFKARQLQLAKIKSASTGAGYKGYENISVPEMISTTQAHGGLEEYLNVMIDSDTGDSYKYIKAISILDDAVLYSYSGRDAQFVIHVEKNPGKLYQEGQTLEQNFYVLIGMYNYVSTSGANKSVPSFKPVYIDY